jgi:hypothetical protein
MSFKKRGEVVPSGKPVKVDELKKEEKEKPVKVEPDKKKK